MLIERVSCYILPCSMKAAEACGGHVLVAPATILDSRVSFTIWQSGGGRTPMAIEGWVGSQGQGKTYLMVTRCLQASAAGSDVYSNLQIRGCRYFETWDQLMHILETVAAKHDRAVIAIDEAGKFLSSRFWQKADPRMLMLVQERRKIGRGVDFFFSVPSWRMVDAHLRDVTQRLYMCKRYGGTEYSHDGGRPPWFFLESAFWPEDMSSEHARVRPKAKRHRVKIVWFTPEVAACYATGVVHMDVPMAAAVSQRPDYFNVQK